MLTTKILCVVVGLLLQPAPQSSEQGTHRYPKKRDSSTWWDECVLIRSKDLTDLKAPSFTNYPSAATAGAEKLDSQSPADGRSEPGNVSSANPNFAGHYRAAVQGCGSSCIVFDILDLANGRVVQAKGLNTVSGGHLEAESFLPEGKGDSWGLRFVENSRLLVVLGTLNEDNANSGAFYYVIEQDHLKLVHTTKVTKSCSSRGT